MNLFLANKKLNFGVTLEELKKMTPQEAYLFAKDVREAARRLQQQNFRR